MKRCFFIFALIAIAALFAVSCQKDVETSIVESDLEFENAGEIHNSYLVDILSYLNTHEIFTRTDNLTPETFAQEVAKIQSSVLTNVNLEGMSREQVISHIKRNIDVSISPDVISIAQNIADNPDVSILSELNKNGELSPLLSDYVTEVDRILTSPSTNDVTKINNLDLVYLNYYREANPDERKLISATHDIFKKSKEYWEDNGAAWEQTIGKSGTLRGFIWGVARADGWALIKAVYSAGWYYATMFWKEMLIASGVASAISAVATIIREIGTSSINGEILYSINGSEPISESQLKEMIFQEVIIQNPELNLEFETNK